MGFTKHMLIIVCSSKGTMKDFLILLLYVDDMLIVGQDMRKIGSLKKALGKSFSMKDLGLDKQILGMHIVWDRTKKVLMLSQKNYVIKVL